MVMPREVVRELTRSRATSGPESGNSRVPWPMTTGYRELPPPTPLNAHIACFWMQHVSEEESGYRHRTVPNGCIVIQASLQHRRIAVIGPHQRARMDHLAPGAAVIGIRLFTRRGFYAPGPGPFARKRKLFFRTGWPGCMNGASCQRV